MLEILKLKKALKSLFHKKSQARMSRFYFYKNGSDKKSSTFKINLAKKLNPFDLFKV